MDNSEFIGLDKINAIRIRDDIVPADLQEAIGDMVAGPIWRYGWHSNSRQDRYGFWHAHFAGGDGNTRAECATELLQKSSVAPVARLWEHLSHTILTGHQPLRVYANAHTHGVEGYVHTDSTDQENYFTTVYYAHRIWRKNWSGETLFFATDEENIIKSVYPKPGRLVMFPGSIPHMAHAPSRVCPELRITVVIKTQIVA